MPYIKSMNERDKGTLLKKFEALYPEPETELNYHNQYQLLISVVLSAQCTDKKVNEITPKLFKPFPSFEHLSKAGLKQVETIIRPINYYKTKAKNIIALSKKIVTEHHGKLPHSHPELVSLPGVGQKTANVVLSELGITPAFPVDTHVFRLARRLGLAKSETIEQVESELTRQFPPETWRPLHHWLIFHGRRVCKARKPLCSQCAIADLCPSVETAG